MTRTTFRQAAAGLLTVTTFIATPLAAQERSTDPVFASENAVLDTSIPFVIGAREARQELRGSFGWPTFQEGLVNGIYFRFDPDGYARFAATPRLDTDVFEVICRSRTLICMARKDGFSISLGEDGHLQLRFDGAADGDQFFLADGLNEVEIPGRVMGPLDQPLELLLSSGGNLIVRRQGAEVQRVSLSGFPIVVAYLRWVAAQQDYLALPSGWPVPGGVAQTADLSPVEPTEGIVAPATQVPPLWPNTAPQGAEPTSDAYASALAPPAPGSGAAPAAPTTSMNSLATWSSAPLQVPGASITNPMAAAPMATSGPDGQSMQRIAELEAQISTILDQLMRLDGALGNQAHGLNSMDSMPMDGRARAVMGDSGESYGDRDHAMYQLSADTLVELFAVDPENAAILVAVHELLVEDAARQAAMTSEPVQDPIDILLDRLSQRSSTNPSARLTREQGATEAEPEQDFQLLSDYFRSLATEG